MKIHRFYLETLDINNKEIILNAKKGADIASLLHQMYNVLRLNIGEKIVLFNSDTLDYIFEIVDINKNVCTLSFIEQKKNIIQNQNSFYLHLPIIKKDNFYLILEKATELGIMNFCPTLSFRTEKKNVESFIKDIEKDRLFDIFKEAIEQSGQRLVPRLHKQQCVEDAINNIIKENNIKKEANKESDIDKIFILDFEGKDIKDIINNKKDYFVPQNNIHFFIGPEGGWDVKERDFFKNIKDNNPKSVFIISLCDQVLRAETACISVANLRNILL